MAPKHGVAALKEEQQMAKRHMTEAAAGSRSATPADLMGRVPFEVKYPPIIAPGSKRKVSKREQDLLDHSEFMESPFVALGAPREGDLNQRYTVVPSEDWSAMKKYNNFIIQGETYKNNQFVFVRGETTPQGKSIDDTKDFWVARILQVRAKNAQHVYALVAWMYWPEELPPPKRPAPDQVDAHSGKRTYHGSQELLASNYMEVLDVLSFAGKAEVGHWLEDDDNLPEKLYWRQTYCRETQELSNLREHCVCDGFYNPNVPMDICENSSCKVWLHDQCIIDDALAKAYKRLVEDDSSAEPDTTIVANGSRSGASGGVGRPSGKRSKANSKPWSGKLTGKLNLGTDKEPTTITITDLRPDGQGSWTERIPCPKCAVLLG